MSWLLFLDESGHDHKSVPYEIHGGFSIHASRLWAFLVAIRTLELSVFGENLHQFGSELKGSKLLDKKRFKWAQQAIPLDQAARRKHALNFLNSSHQSRTPRREEFTAFGQACLDLAEGVIRLLKDHDAVLFAAIIPQVKRPLDDSGELLRKDLVFLLERYFYFLEEQQEMGLIVMDGTEKQADRKVVRRLERYFTQTMVGRQRTQWIVPAPFFVESDMEYGIQIADLCAYTLNWGWRLPTMNAPTRQEVVPFGEMLNRLIWHGEGRRDGNVFRTHSVVYVPDPYQAR